MSKTNNVGHVTSAVESMQPYWAMVDALRGGTETMREAGRLYLPQEPKESDAAYAIRLQRSVLFNATNRTIETLASKPFTKPVTLSEDMPPDVEEWMENVDLQGNTIDTFGLQVFDAALADGLTHILVDYPIVDRKLTLREERDSKLRPYAVHLSPRNVLGWRVESQHGREVITQLRFQEVVEVPDGDFGVKEVQRIRVIEPYRQRVYERTEGADYMLVTDVPTSMKEVPLVTIYTKRTGALTAKPPLLDLMYLNVTHWQSSSDQRNILHVARVPLLFGRGFNDQDVTDLEIGASRMIYNPETSSDLKYVEVAGNAIDAGRQDMNDLKDEMGALGLELIMSNRPGALTATEKSIDTAQSDSALVVLSRQLENGLNNMMRYFGEWIKRDVGSISLHTDFHIVPGKTTDAELLFKSRVNGDITAETYWHELQRRGILSEDFDSKEEKKQLEETAEPPPPMLLDDDEEEDVEEEAA